MLRQRFFRRTLSACLAAVMVLSLVSCNGGNQGNGSANPGPGVSTPGSGNDAGFDGEM